MDTQAHKSSSFGTIGFMIAAIIFAAVAGLLLSQVMESTYSQEPVKPIVVAAKSLPASQLIKKGDLKIANWPESSIPSNAFTKIDDVVETTRVPLIPLVPGEAVLNNHLSRPNSGLGIAPLLEPNKRAMSIPTDDPVTLARLLYPGARVDVLTTIRETRNREDGKPNVSTKIVLQNIKVLAVGEDIDPLTISERRRLHRKKQEEGAMGDEPSGESKEKRGVVTLSVTPEEAERLALARREGKLDIILRNPKDNAVVETDGATPVAFLPVDETEQMFELEETTDTRSTTRQPRRRKSAGRKAGTKPKTKRTKSGVVIIN